MGLLDIINGMENGPRGQTQPSGAPASGGMSPVTMALLGLLAYKAVKHFSGAEPGTMAGQPTSMSPGNPGAGANLGGLAGGLGGVLGNLFGTGTGAGGIGARLNEMVPGGLGGLLAGAGAGGMLSGGLGRLVQDLQNSGQGKAVQSWIGNGANAPVAPGDLEHAIGNDDLDALAKHTGINRDELLATLSRNLPQLVDALTPNGRLPTNQEAGQMI